MKIGTTIILALLCTACTVSENAYSPDYIQYSVGDPYQFDPAWSNTYNSGYILNTSNYSGNPVLND